MVTKSPTIFDAFEFTEDEERGLIFSEIQTMYLRTELASIAMQKVQMAVPEDINALELYLRRQEYLRGQMEILMGILGANATLIQNLTTPDQEH